MQQHLPVHLRESRCGANEAPPRGGRKAAWRPFIGDAAPLTASGPVERRNDDTTVSVVFSFWNEEEVLPELIRRVRAVFDLLIASGEVADYELLFVNDASTDRSEEVLKAAAQKRGDIRIVNMARNFGVSPCVLAGMQFARGDAVVYMDADLQDPPERIPEMLAAWKADPDVHVVHTVRCSRRGESLLKRGLTHLGYKLLRATSKIDLPHEAGDFKLLSRRVVRHLLEFPEKRPFMRGLVCFVGYKQATVTYHREARQAGASKFPVLGFKVLSNFFDSALISFSDLPLRAPALLGNLLLLAGAICLGSALFLAQATAGWFAIAGVVLLTGGCQLLGLGILGKYVMSIFLETKRRPNYIVRDLFGFEETATAARPAEPAQAGDSA
ncbi:MAG: glycosyltransferase family 2 protein [Planctomycetia bacterium]|nr:glycosyltransferase family 2 protein [Planctomycetia bacterium]